MRTRVCPRTDRNMCFVGSADPRSSTEPSETAEKVQARIGRPVSRQEICLDQHSEPRRTAASTSAFRVDRIGAGEIYFFSRLVEKRTFVIARSLLPLSRSATADRALSSDRPSAAHRERPTAYHVVWQRRLPDPSYRGPAPRWCRGQERHSPHVPFVSSVVVAHGGQTPGPCHRDRRAMSHDKIKAAARDRMARTGESYSTARRAVINEHRAASRGTDGDIKWFAIRYSRVGLDRLAAFM